jgi:hypothetical protein
MEQKSFCKILILFMTAASASCTGSLKDSLEIKTNGFITSNCYQAILEIEPEDSARGLVSKRESSYIKAKKTVLKNMALENLANFCIESRLKTGLIDKNRKDTDLPGMKKALIPQLDGMAGGGQIAFVYYNERNSMIIGYRLFKFGFKRKLDSIINPVEQKPDNTNSTAGAKS